MSMAPQQADNTPSNFGVNQARARWALSTQANGGNYEGMLGQSRSNARRPRSAAADNTRTEPFGHSCDVGRRFPAKDACVMIR